MEERGPGIHHIKESILDNDALDAAVAEYSSRGPKVNYQGKYMEDHYFYLDTFDALGAYYEIIDILKGDMSVVGPRPERVEHVEQYTAEVPEFSYRLKVKCGLTGYAQIYGKYNTTAYDKLKLDLMYIQNYSILLDLKLIIMTGKILFVKESTEGFEEKK